MFFYSETITNLKNNIQQKYNKNAEKVLKEAEKWDNAAGDFARNYNDMVEANTKYSDKYFHAKANCQASQRGLGGEVISHALSLSREIEEGIRKVILEGKDPIKQIKDAGEDMKANSYGRNLGKNNKNIQCKVLLKDKRPNGLDDKY